MTKSSNKDSDGVLRFTVVLDGALKKHFLDECETELRDMTQQIRFILKQRYDALAARREYEEFKRQQKGRSSEVPHFGDETPDLQAGAAG